MGPDFNGTGLLYVKSIKNKSEAFKPLSKSPSGIFDGLSLYDETHLIVSDWVSFLSTKGRILLYDLKNNTTKVLPFVSQSPADFYFDAKTRKLFIPQTLSNNVLVFDLQKQNINPKANILTHFGLIKSFVGGLYDGYFPYSEIKKYGDFGIFAPGNLDGEGTVNNGTFYQTHHSGKTHPVADSSKVSVAFINFFKRILVLI